MVIDAGPTQYQQFATVVRIEDEGWSIERPGVVDAATLMQSASLIILFVCTGNTCRSPMAEAICKVLLARRLGCQVAELEGRGIVIRSAGVAASNGVPAAAHAIDVVRALGGSLENHRSRKIAANLVRQADCIFAMTGDHLDALLDAIPEVEHRTLPARPRRRRRRRPRRPRSRDLSPHRPDDRIHAGTSARRDGFLRGPSAERTGRAGRTVGLAKIRR